MGVPPAGSGCQPAASAAEEASSRSGIPNAMRDVSDGISQYIKTFIPATSTANGFSEDGIARKVLVGIGMALIHAAAAIEARGIQ